MTNTQKHLIDWARSHDWGRGACLTAAGKIGGLVDGGMLRGVYSERLVEVDATMAALRNFGNY